MTGYFPVGVAVKDREILVVGGGDVGQRKTKQLVEFGAKVTVIAPKVNLDLQVLHEDGKINWIRRSYDEGDLEKYFLVFVATADAELNHEISKEAKKKKILVNVADDPDYCDFILPSIVRRGKLVVSVSTSGASPAMARRIREKLEDDIGKEYEDVLNLMEKLRNRLLSDNKLDTKERGKLLLKFTKNDLPSLFRDDKIEEINKELKSIFGYTIDELG